jgi:hypothetical protein
MIVICKRMRAVGCRHQSIAYSVVYGANTVYVDCEAT